MGERVVVWKRGLLCGREGCCVGERVVVWKRGLLCGRGVVVGEREESGAITSEAPMLPQQVTKRLQLHFALQSERAVFPIGPSTGARCICIRNVVIQIVSFFFTVN